MHYLGSKARHAKEIIEITCANRRPDQFYVEPFVGGGNVICKVPHGAGRVANDKNYGMVALLDALGNKGWIPPETMTKAEWSKIMKQDVAKLDPLGQALFAFAATGPTFGSMWAGQWAKDYPGMEGTRYRQARDAALNDAPGLAGILFSSGSYDAFDIPPESVVYCDPPYVNTTEYSGAKTTIKVGESLNKNNWKADPFWAWCDKLVDQGCDVYVSEYRGPMPAEMDVPDDMKGERKGAALKLTSLQKDENSSSEDIQAAFDHVMAVDSAIAEYKRTHTVERWKPVWEKEVVSDFSATREENAKREMEKLFHRER